MLDEEAHRRAGELGISFAELVRRAVDHEVREPAPQGDISRIFGLFNSGGSNVARHKDRYVDEAVSAPHPRRGS